jgi:hypothetical protein
VDESGNISHAGCKVEVVSCGVLAASAPSRRGKSDLSASDTWHCVYADFCSLLGLVEVVDVLICNVEGSFDVCRQRGRRDFIDGHTNCLQIDLIEFRCVFPNSSISTFLNIRDYWSDLRHQGTGSWHRRIQPTCLVFKQVICPGWHLVQTGIPEMQQ